MEPRHTTPHTAKAKNAISQSLRGNKNRVGKVLSPEHKEALTAHAKGNKHGCGTRSPETRARMSAAQLARSAQIKALSKQRLTPAVAYNMTFVTEFLVNPSNYSFRETFRNCCG